MLLLGRERQGKAHRASREIVVCNRPSRLPKGPERVADLPATLVQGPRPPLSAVWVVGDDGLEGRLECALVGGRARSLRRGCGSEREEEHGGAPGVEAGESHGCCVCGVPRLRCKSVGDPEVVAVSCPRASLE